MTAARRNNAALYRRFFEEAGYDQQHIQLPEITGYRLSVFDRYGNLLAVMDETHSGWDGTAAGRNLPAADYWYRLELEEGRVIQGHFALRR